MVTKAFRVIGGGVQTLSQALGRDGVKAKAVQLIGDAGNTGQPLIGGSDVSPAESSPLVPAVGFPISKTTPLYLPYASIWTDLYDFNGIYVYVAPGDIVDVLYEQG